MSTLSLFKLRLTLPIGSIILGTLRSDTALWKGWRTMCVMWGWNGASVNLGKLDTKDCPTCKKKQNFVVSVTYRYSHVFWWPLFSWGTKYFYHCQVCQHGFELEGDKLKPYLTTNPKPWIHRYGWTVPTGIIFLSWFIPWIFGEW
jgi:hypothetical protein